MKTAIYILGLSVISLTTFGQAKKAPAKKTTPKKTTSTTPKPGSTPKADEKPMNCILSSFSTGPDNFKITYRFTNNEKDEVTRAASLFGKQTNVFTFAYDSINRLTTVADSSRKKEIGYVYNEKNQLIEITGTGTLLTRRFEYDEQGRIIKKNTVYKGGQTQSLHEYVYDEKGVITKINVTDGQGEKMLTYLPVYDHKKNPLKSLSIFINTSEMMLGYPAYQLNGNLVKVTTIYEKKNNYKVNGNFKEPGEQDVQTFTYKYNGSGYPTEVSYKLGNGVMSKESFTYDCKPLK